MHLVYDDMPRCTNPARGDSPDEAAAADSPCGHGRDAQPLAARPAGDEPDRHDVLPLRALERAHIRRVLGLFKGNKRQAARALNISRDTLYRKISEYGLRADSRPAHDSAPAKRSE